MTVAIHQPHYFPWLGLLDKMAKSDQFILLDEVQLTDKSNMFRNKFLAKNGREKYLTVCFEKKDYMSKKFSEVALNRSVNWQKDHINFLKDNYKKSDYFEEIYQEIECIFTKEYSTLCEVAVDSLLCVKKIFDIRTPIILQSELQYDTDAKKNEMVLSLCKAVGASSYLSGNGAKKYMDIKRFEEEGVEVHYQVFTYPIYSQIGSPEVFVPNLSSLDLLFNYGIAGAKKIFWDNVNGVNLEGEEK